MSQVGARPHFEQIYLVEISGSNKTIKQPPFPDWRFDDSAEPARLELKSASSITRRQALVQKITIELYDYRPEKATQGGSKPD